MARRHVFVDKDIVWADKLLDHISLDRDFVAVGCSNNAERTKDLVKDCSPCVYLIGEQGFAELAQQGEDNIKELVCVTHVLVFVRDQPVDSGLGYLLSGCSGILKEGTPAETVQEAIRAVLREELWFPRRAQADIIKTLLGRQKGLSFTPRETEILRLVGEGQKNEEIARSLFICRETVRWHLRRLYSKCGTSDRRELAVVAKSPRFDAA